MADDPPRSRNVKLTDAEWEALERIAWLNGLEWGGIPSRSDAVRLLIRRELERLGGICEHGIDEWDYCPSCNAAYKRARIENGLDGDDPV